MFRIRKDPFFLTVFLVIGLLALVLGLGLSLNAPTARAKEINTALILDSSDPIAQAGYCGDGFCDAYRGENGTTCPIDCSVQRTTTPTSTRPPVTDTSTPLLSLTPDTTEEGTGTPTSTPTDTPTVTPEPEPGVACGFVSYESRTVDWKSAYARSTIDGGYIPVRAVDEQEVYQCDEPIAGELCFQVYDNLMDTVDDDMSLVTLVNCTDGGDCEQIATEGGLSLDQLCFTVPSDEPVVCSDGCAVAPLEPALPRLGLSALPVAGIALGCGFLAVIIGLVGIVLIMRRRKKDEEESEVPE